MAQRPVPRTNALTEPYWSAARSGTFVLYRCTSCERVSHPPLHACSFCGSVDGRFVTAPTRGVVESYSVVHRSFAPGFADRVPYVIAWVSLPTEPPVRVFGNILGDLGGADQDELRVGAEVEVVFDEIAGYGSVPNFRLAARAGERR